MSEVYLIHHGIKGMKWGVRRYQNEDGTLTDAGKARYRLANSSGGFGGPKIGRGRYQNPDGTLTEAGEKRWKRDVLNNNAKKKDNRIKDLEETGPDPDRWVKEDFERMGDVISENERIVKEAAKIEKALPPKQNSEKKPDLSDMSDKELREKINRELLERQYNQLFNEVPKEQISKGREALRKTLEVAGPVLAITGSVLTIAVKIRDLMNS